MDILPIKECEAARYIRKLMLMLAYSCINNLLTIWCNGNDTIDKNSNYDPNFTKGEKDWNTFQACKMLMMDILTCLFKNVVHFTTVLKCSF